MPNTGNLIQIKHGTLAQYNAATKNADTIYFITDAKKVFVGDTEYTEAVINLDAAPTGTGITGRIYHYNGTLYIYDGSAFTKVANYNDKFGTVTGVTAGGGLTGGTINSAGTIAHAFPAPQEGANTEKALGLGDTFEVKTVKLDTFGHVVGEDIVAFTLPAETALTVTPVTDKAQTLAAGSKFTVVTEVEKGEGSHEIKRTVAEFTLPEDKNTTYTLAKGESDGSVKLVSTDGTEVHADVVITGWENLAKKSDLTAVFKFKGSVANEAALPEGATVGDVYHVTDTQGEFVYTENGWEELGITVSLEGYATEDSINNALKAYMKLVPGAAENKIAVFDANGQVVAGAKTIDELIDELTYTHPSHTAYGEGLYKVTVDAQGHVTKADAVTIADIDKLGAVAEAKKATQDGDGNIIKDTYATKTELEAAGLKWQSI